MKSRICLLTVTLIASIGVTEALAVVTVTSNYAYVSIYDHDAAFDTYDSYTGTTFPISTSISAEIPNNSAFYSRMDIDWYNQGITGEVFNLDMDQQREGGIHDCSYADYSLDFTISGGSVDYDLSGFFNATNVSANTPGRVYYRVYFYGSENLFYSVQYSEATLNESFVLGSGGGDYTDIVTGTLTGTLAPGDYRLELRAWVDSYPGSDLGAAALGNFKLALGNTLDAAPEPTTLAIWSTLSGLGLLAARRRRKAA